MKSNNPERGGNLGGQDPSHGGQPKAATAVSHQELSVGRATVASLPLAVSHRPGCRRSRYVAPVRKATPVDGGFESPRIVLSQITLQ